MNIVLMWKLEHGARVKPEGKKLTQIQNLDWILVPIVNHISNGKSNAMCCYHLSSTISTISIIKGVPFFLGHTVYVLIYP